MQSAPRSGRWLTLGLLCSFVGCASFSDSKQRPPHSVAVAVAGRDAVRVPIAAGHTFVLLDLATSKRRIQARDAFMQGISPLDRQVRMSSVTPVSEAAFAEYVGQQVREFGPAQIQKLTLVSERVGKALLALDLLRFLPSEIELVHTSGAEEGFGPIFDLSYTRSGVIYVNTRALEVLSRHLLLHELFHVLCASRPELAERLYASIGFVPVGPPRLSSALEAERLTLPENPSPRHALRVSHQGRTLLAMPLTFVPQPYTGGAMVDVSVSLWALLGDRNDVTRAVPLDELSGFREQLGENTQMLASPEEILAENFVLLALQEPKVASPHVLERMREILRSTPEL